MRELIYDALVEDQVLIDLGFDDDHIMPNYGFEDVPRDKMFLIIRFSEQEIIAAHIGRGPEVVEVWCHMPKEVGNDMVAIREVLTEVKDIIMGLEGQSDSRYRITAVKFDGMGGDLSDPGYNTYTKNLAFRVLSHPVG